MLGATVGKAKSAGKVGVEKAESAEEAGGAKKPKQKSAAPTADTPHKTVFSKEQKKERHRLVSLAYKRGFREGKDLGYDHEKKTEMARAAHKKAGEEYDAA